MLLPELFLPSLAGVKREYSGIDSPEHCVDPAHFARYPHSVQYNYNSRGFRDQEWPSDLNSVIWCVGDSFTHGLGVPQSHTWPAVLQRRTARRCINISMDGASNMWIARMALAILAEFDQADVVLHWSFIHRRELNDHDALHKKFNHFYHNVKDPSWPNCDYSSIDQLPAAIKFELIHRHGWNTEIYSNDRVTQWVRSDTAEDVVNTQRCRDLIPAGVIQTAIPEWTPKDVSIPGVIEIQPVDLARDGFHYDVATSNLLVDLIMSAWADRATAPAL